MSRQWKRWEIAQGIPAYEAYQEARARQEARDEAVRLRLEGGFDAAVLTKNKGPQPFRLPPGALAGLLAEEQNGTVQIHRDETGTITGITRINKNY